MEKYKYINREENNIDFWDIYKINIFDGLFERWSSIVFIITNLDNIILKLKELKEFKNKYILNIKWIIDEKKQNLKKEDIIILTKNVSIIIKELNQIEQMLYSYFINLINAIFDVYIKSYVEEFSKEEFSNNELKEIKNKIKE